jgi:hypothetical protein
MMMSSCEKSAYSRWPSGKVRELLVRLLLTLDVELVMYSFCSRASSSCR